MQPPEGCARWTVRLFGRFTVQVAHEHVDVLPGRRTSELLAYLLLFRERPHHREVLAGTLWPDSGTTQSRKYLRQALWHLRTLDSGVPDAARLLELHTDWIEVRDDGLWLDVAELEQAFAPVRLRAGEQVSSGQAARIRQAVSVYRGDLLEGCYQDWCVYERERLKAMHIALLEKLLGYCEAHGLPGEGLGYTDELLRQDPAHERAHWRRMRLLYLSGDRTGALRQFDRCRQALHDELGVAPGDRIVRLREQIRDDRGIDPLTPQAPVTPPEPAPPDGFVPEPAEISALQEALQALARAEHLVRQRIRATLDPDA